MTLCPSDRWIPSETSSGSPLPSPPAHFIWSNSFPLSKCSRALTVQHMHGFDVPGVIIHQQESESQPNLSVNQNKLTLSSKHDARPERGVVFSILRALMGS